MTSLAIHPGLAALGSSLRGRLALPSNADWDAVRAPWNLSVDQHPAAVAFPADVADVVRIVVAARAAGLGVLVQPHGHGAGGELSDCIVIRPTAFDELTVDAARRVARVGAGVDWGAVLSALDGTGLVALAGSNPAVNTVAYTLGGGHSSFSRAFGLAAASAIAFDAVLADGSEVRVDAAADPELFWSLRGGGGGFAVVTAMEFRLHPISAASGMLYGGKLTYPATRAADVLSALFEVAAAAPAEVGLTGVLMRLPDAPMVPEPLRAQTLATVDVVSLLGPDETERHLAPLRAVGAPVADTIASFPIGSFGAVVAEPTEPMPAVDASALLGAADRRLADELVQGFHAGAELGLSLVQLRPLGGAVAAPGPDPGVAGAIGARVLLGATAILSGDATADPAAAVSEMLRAAQRVRVPGRVVTFLGAHETLADAYGPADIERLRAVKQRVDPDGLLRSTRPLPPV